MSRFMSSFLRDECGATAVEYGLIIALIALVLVSALGAMSAKLNSTFGKISSTLP